MGKSPCERSKRKAARPLRVWAPRGLAAGFACICLLLLASGSRANEVTFGDITIECAELFPGDVCHGYKEYRFSITNTSRDRRHRVELLLPAEPAPGFGDSIQEVRRSVDVSPSSSVRVGLLQPLCFPLHGASVAFNVDGRRQANVLELRPVIGGLPEYSYGRYSGSYGRYSSYQQPHNVLVSPDTPIDFETRLNELKRSIERTRSGFVFPPGVSPPPGFTGGVFPPESTKLSPDAGTFLESVKDCRAIVPVTDWDPGWLAYSGYDAILLTAEELAKAPDNVRTALFQYAEVGGNLTILGKWKPPGKWTERRENFGTFSRYYPAFGNCLVVPETAPSKWKASTWEQLAFAWERSAAVAFGDAMSEGQANMMLPVASGGIPVRGLFILMVLFCVVMGPVNLTVLSRKKRRIWMLWTVPAISLLTCAAVFGYMIVAEGWTGHVRSMGITLLDEKARRATTIGWTAFYTPLVRGDGLHFGTDTEVSPLLGSPEMQTDYRYRRDGSGRSVDWTSDQNLASGWLASRVPVHYRLRKSETRRERVAVKRGSDGKLSLVNGLGADIGQIWYADETGKLYSAGPVRAGGEAVLVDTGEKVAKDPAPEGIANLLRSGWQSKIDANVADAKLYLLPRHYLAKLQGTPFMEQALPSAAVGECHSVVIGIPRDPGDAD